jgi:hypothetical protein
VLRRDRDATDRYLLLVEFSSYELGRENSDRPATGDFRNLDMLREEDL